MPEARPHLHSDTEIYAAVIALAKFCVLASRQMPRDVKQLLGAQLRDETLWMTVLIQRANIARDAAKLPHLVELQEHLELVTACLPEQLGVRLNPAKTILQPVARGIDFCGHVLKPHRRTLRRRTFNDALHRLSSMPEAQIHQAANSYLGLVRQTTHGHRDRARVANVVRRRGFSVDHQLTKTYRRSA